MYLSRPRPPASDCKMSPAPFRLLLVSYASATCLGIAAFLCGYSAINSILFFWFSGPLFTIAFGFLFGIGRG